MDKVNLTSRESIRYQYDPSDDSLTIRLSDTDGQTIQERIAHSEHLSLRRDADSGSVVEVIVTGVQPLLLERLVRDLFFELQPLLSHAAPLPAIPSGELSEGPREDEPTADEAEAREAASTQPEDDDLNLDGAPAKEEAADTATSPQPETATTEEVGDPPSIEAAGPIALATAEPEPAVEDALGAVEAVSTSVTDADPDDEATTTPKRRRRRRGGRRRKKKDQQETDGVADPDALTPAAATQPDQPAQQRTPAESARDTERVAEQETSAPTMAGRSAPIPGLGAPESFEFMGLHPHIGQVITVLDFEQPTPIQRRAVPEIMAGNDVIGLSQTGTGKTLAFLAPALHRLLEEQGRRHMPRVLVLTPTRELAVQVADEANTLAMHTDLRITTLYGGARMGGQIRDLKRGVDIIVATPGRLMDHMRRGNVRLNKIDYLVLDEADRMLDMGFLPDVRTILRDLPRKRQTHLFSATMPPPIEALSMAMQHNPVVIEVARQKPAEGIEQLVYPVERHLKLPLLVHLLKRNDEMSSVLVFTETKAEADIVGRKLKEQGINVVIMHGDIGQRDRERSLGRLSDGSARVLVATNVAARGLDISAISHIVNYDMPQGVDEYVHRIGRTARGDAEGHAYTFASLSDYGMLSRIEGALERELPRVEVDDFDYDVETPSWAKPSAQQITDQLTKPGTLAERFKTMMGRRR